MGRTSVLVIIALLWAPQIHAGLDEDESTVMRDMGRLNAHNHRMFDRGSFRVHTSQLDNGITINEYVSSGKTFAVTWGGGRTNPDLEDLFATYFNEYQQADSLVPSHARGNKVHKGSRKVEAANITVETSGHMGNVTGRAWVNSRLPKDFNLTDLK